MQNIICKNVMIFHYFNKWFTLNASFKNERNDEKNSFNFIIWIVHKDLYNLVIIVTKDTCSICQIILEMNEWVNLFTPLGAPRNIQDYVKSSIHKNIINLRLND